MGNKTLTQQASCQILTKYWDPIASDLYRNRSTHETIRQKKLAFRTDQEMKYVFNCLLKRMNNTHSNVIKVVYLRKFIEDGSLCDCGNRYVILVYVEHLQLKLKQYLVKQRSIGNTCAKNVDNINANGTNKFKGSQMSVISNSLAPYRKCLCVSILKAAQYLKERYGTFKLNADKIWLQPYTSSSSQFKLQTQFSPNQQFTSPKFKPKVWISSQQQQNFPDQSCQQRQMCHSIIQLLQEHIIQSNLCKCYSNESMSVIGRYSGICKLKQLYQQVLNDHNSKDVVKPAQNLQNGYVTKRQVLVPQRAVRSFSSYEPGHKGFQGNVIQRQFQGQAARKYTSIEVGRGRGQVVGNAQRGNVNQSHNWVSLNGHAQQSFPNEHPLPQYTSLSHHHISQSPAHSNPPPKPCTPMQSNQYSLPLPVSITVPQSHSSQPPKHNRPYSQQPQKSILSIADFAPTAFPNRMAYTLSHTPQHPSPSNNQPPPSLTPVQFPNPTNPTSASLDKTHPTDRTKDISLKQQSKKEVEAMMTSRKNISIMPISLESTYGAGSGIKQVLHSYDHVARQREINNQRASIDFNYEGKDQDDENKKESASSSKSEQGYCSGGQQRGKTEREKFWGKRRRDRMVANEEKTRPGRQHTVIEHKQSIQNEPNPIPNQPITISQNLPKTQPPTPSRPKVQTLSLTSPNEDLIRLRQSEYIISAQNSFMNSKHQSHKQSKQVSQKLQASKKLTSLAEMQAKFHTVNRVESAMQSREHHDQVNSSRPGSECGVGSTENIQGKMVTVEEIVRDVGEYNRVMSVEKLQQLKEKSSSKVNDANDLMQPVTIPAIPIGSYSHHSSNVTSSVRQKALSSDKVSSFIIRQPQQPISHVSNEPHPHPSPTQQSQQLSPTPAQKLHQKTHSNPTLAHNPITKNKSLKQQFSNILDFPKENSFRAFTQNKQKLLTLDQKEGRQTYSIYNESEYGQSRGQSQRQLKSTGNDKLPPNHTGQKSKWRKPFSKQELEKEIQQKKLHIQKEAQQLLRLTSSGHEDNSIKQKVRNKKAEFAQLKNQMNSLLL